MVAKFLKPMGPLLLVAALFFTLATSAQTMVQFKGTNTPGTGKNFSFKTTLAMTNISLGMAGSQAGYSHILLRKGVAPNLTTYDFTSQLNGTGNSIHLQLPEATSTTWWARVYTPSNAPTHAFLLNVMTNRAGMRTALPVTKPTAFSVGGTVAQGQWNHFRIEVRTNSAIKISLTSIAKSPDLYVQRGKVPTLTSSLKRTQNLTNDVITFSPSELTPGAYFISVYSPSGTVNYTLRTDILKIVDMEYDPGDTHAGTYVYTNKTTTTGAEFYYRIKAGTPSVGGWRTALNVLSGDAALYMGRTFIPSISAASYKSERVGSDGFVLGPSKFNAGEDWYILVRAKTNTTFSLVSGAAHVADLGELATDGSSSTNVTMGAEGWRFFRTSIPTNTLAWQLWVKNTNGAPTANQIYIRKPGVPLEGGSEHDLTRSGQMLVVAPNLAVNQLYFIGVVGNPGSQINLVSRQQPITDIPFTSVTNVLIKGFGFRTYRVQVPPDQIAWQITAVPTVGDVNVYLRRNLVPSESYNEAFSENGGISPESISLVPPTLSDGTFYLTVSGTEDCSFTLRSRLPTITDINYNDQIVNDEPNLVGWRYFRVANIDQQLGSLGWELLLQNCAPGTRIALRRNKAPGIWMFRNPGTSPAKYYDIISPADFLQRPSHQADVWYIGVFNPTVALTNFTLTTRDIPSETLVGDGGKLVRASVAPFRWEYFRVDVPDGVSGWDVRLLNVSGTNVHLVVRREGLPYTDVQNGDFTFRVSTTLNVRGATWGNGLQWAANKDWTMRERNAVGVDETGRILAMGINKPLEPATYYVGVLNAGGAPASFTVSSRFIGNGRSIPVPDLPYAGGRATNSVTPREAAYYRVNIPSPVKSWKLRLTTTSGEAMMVVSTNRLPHVESEKRVQKAGKEHYVLLPDSGNTSVRPGDYYIAVVGEGLSPTNSNTIGTGKTSFILESLGAAPEFEMGSLVSAPLTASGSVEGGESKFYHFTTAGNLPGFYAILENKIGNPVMVALSSCLTSEYCTASNEWFAPDPGAGGNGTYADTYGNEGGERNTSFLAVSNAKILAEGADKRETIAIKARGQSGVYTNSSYTLRVQPILPPSLAFNNGIQAVTNQPAGTWRFFKIVVPVSTRGWDIRLTNVVSGSPILTVAKDVVPSSPSTATFDPATSSVWWWRWAAGRDWTERSLSPTGINQDGRILTCGMGRPLEPGTYYAGVYAQTTSTYTIHSRGIGPGFAIPIRDLNFAGGSFTTNGLVSREPMYFRVNIPGGALGWKLKLNMPTNHEAMMVVLKDTIPNILPSREGSVVKSGARPRKSQKTGEEHFLLLPKGSVELTGGEYFVAVVGEGMWATNSSRIGTNKVAFTLSSSPVPIVDLGTLTNGVTRTGALAGAECLVYKFDVPAGTTSLEARLENRVGNPFMVWRSGNLIPDPGIATAHLPSDTYGNEGGEDKDINGGPLVLSVPNPAPGNHYLVVKARQTNNVYTNAAYTLRLNVSEASTLAFDGGQITVTNQQENTWRFFKVVVPSGPLGWDLRLTNVLSGGPRIVVRREAMPNGFSTTPWSSPGTANTWASSNQWVAGSDWTRRNQAVDGADESGRILAMGMDRPLVPGVYVVGVMNPNPSAAMTYTIWSRGIGTGMSIGVTDVAYENGNLLVTNLAPRDASYFRLAMPENAASWRMKLAQISGETMAVVLRGFVPNVQSAAQNSSVSQGRTLQKAGNEHFVLLPPDGQTNIQGNTDYFIAVVGEGNNPQPGRVGPGTSAFRLMSLGPVVTKDIGTTSLSEMEQADALEGSEIKFYQFTVSSNAMAVELRLDERIGNPNMTLRKGDWTVDPSGGDSYGNEGGYPASDIHPSLLTIAKPVAGTYQLAIKAKAGNNGYLDASYKLRIRELAVNDLNFGSFMNTNGLSNSVSGTLQDNQRAFFKVEVPASVNGSPIVGWKLELRQSSGLAFVRVRKDFLPTDNPSTGTPFTSAAAYIVPPVLTNGIWYVEVKAQNPTTFTLTSSPIMLERAAWLMPGTDETNTAPGLTLPTFGDTAIDTNGNPVPEGLSTFLDQGYQHYYCAIIPTQNLGLARIQLEAVSGNPDLYMRMGSLPTITHGQSGTGGTIYDRQMSGLATEYANWVPFDGKSETKLKPGNWFFAVRAAGNANARYRLRLSVGNIEQITLGDNLTNQVVSGLDFKYYRLQMPNAPVTWQVTFNQVAGDLRLYLRDVVPPGNGASGGDIKDWSSDRKTIGPFPNFEQPDTYTLTMPPTRPGHTYYLGFRGNNDSTFNFSVNAVGEIPPEFPTIAFFGGSASATLPPFGEITYRVFVPTNGIRWKHTSENPANLLFFLKQGTLPAKTSADEWRSSGANTSLSQFLSGAWPWLIDQSYFLTITNAANFPSSFTINLDGRDAAIDDDDADGMLDGWERQYFGSLGPRGTDDNDNDGVTNLQEFQEGTNPIDNSSFRPRLVTATTNGVIDRSITSTNGYPPNTAISVTATPNAGFLFLGWAGALSGNQNPATVILDTNKFVGAVFKLIGDDFATRIPLSGSTISTNAVNASATKEPGEPNHGDNPGGKSLWWTWTSPVSGSTRITTTNSTFNTLLAVYTGSVVSNLTVVAGTNTASGNKAAVTFDAIQGTQYQIAVDGINGGSGTISLGITASAGLFDVRSAAIALPVQLKNFAVSAEGAVQFMIEGQPDQAYVVEVSTNLVDWSDSVTLTNSTSGEVVVTDTNHIGFPQTYYRVRAQQPK